MPKYKNILVVGATSAIAHETMRCFAPEQNSRFYLVSRGEDKLRTVADDLRSRGAAAVETMVADASNDGSHATIISNAKQFLGNIDLVYLAWGELGQDLQQDGTPYVAVAKHFQVNFLSFVAFIMQIKPVLISQANDACLAVVSSVAGDRGRQSNYVYGTAKAALSAYTQGLRNELYSRQVRVVTIKPGLIQTPMTAHLKHGPISATAAETGRCIFRGLTKGKGADVIYAPLRWFAIMKIICLIPEALFKRLRL